MVMPRARPVTSARVQPFRIRRPPLDTPRTSRSTTRYPSVPVTWSVQVREINGAGEGDGTERLLGHRG